MMVVVVLKEVRIFMTLSMQNNDFSEPDKKKLRRQRFEDPIEIPQFYFTRETWDIMNEYCKTTKDIGDFCTILCKYALFNIADEELPDDVSEDVELALGRAIPLIQPGLNRYRWDYFFGMQGVAKRKTNFCPIFKKRN